MVRASASGVSNVVFVLVVCRFQHYRELQPFPALPHLALIGTFQDLALSGLRSLKYSARHGNIEDFHK
jgi:hypothetical protein